METIVPRSRALEPRRNDRAGRRLFRHPPAQRRHHPDEIPRRLQPHRERRADDQQPRLLRPCRRAGVRGAIPSQATTATTTACAAAASRWSTRSAGSSSPTASSTTAACSATIELTDGTKVTSPIRRPHTFYLSEAFKIRQGAIEQIEANFITVPYHMPSPVGCARMTGIRRILALFLLAGVFVLDGYDLNAMALAAPRLQGRARPRPDAFRAGVLDRHDRRRRRRGAARRRWATGSGGAR